MESRKICAIVQDLLPSYVDKLTKPETTSFVDAHLTDCETCRRICRAMAGTLPAEAVQAEHVVHQLKKAHNRRRMIGWGIAAAILLIAALCLLPLPRKINVSHGGILWRCGTQEEVYPTVVQIKGTYWDYLFREDNFTGDIEIEALPKTKGKMSIHQTGEGQYGVWVENDEALLQSLGGMFLCPDGRMIFLLNDEGHWDAATGRMVTAPASTREEAVALANELARELSPNWLGIWTFE